EDTPTGLSPLGRLKHEVPKDPHPPTARIDARLPAWGGKGFEHFGFVLEFLDQAFVGRGVNNFCELRTIVADHADAIHHDVIDSPFPGLTEESIIYRDVAFSREEFGPNLCIITFIVLTEELEPFS